jgi:hypothetical protein
MNEAFKVLEQAKREAEARLRRYEAEGRKHSIGPTRHAIRELEQALRALKWANEEALRWVRLWSLVEEGNRNVQEVHVSDSRCRSGNARRKRRP